MYVLRRTIPNEWIPIILTETEKIDVTPNVNSDTGVLSNLTTNIIYGYIVDKKGKTPVVQERWEQIIQERPNWNLVWRKNNQDIKEVKLRDFNFKFMYQFCAYSSTVIEMEIKRISDVPYV